MKQSGKENLVVSKVDKSQLEEIINKYTPEIQSMAKKYYIVGGNEDDLFQEGMIGLVQAVYDYDINRGEIYSTQFKKFVLMCAKRQIIDAIKHANRFKNQPLNNYLSFDKSLDESREMFESKHLDPEKILLKKEEFEEKTETIKIILSSFEKQVLDYYLDGKNQSEIAVVLNKSVKSIDNTLQRVKNKLKGK